MEVLTRTNGREMTLAISGELDHHGAHGAMQPWCCAHTAAWRRSAEV